MIFLERFSHVAVIISGLAAMLVLVLGNWRRSLLFFGLQYLGVFWLVTLTISPGMGAVKLIAGVMAMVMLAASPNEEEEIRDRSFRPGWIFRLISALLVWVVVISLEPAVATWLGGNLSVRVGGMNLIGMGLLQLGFSDRPGRVILGLLTLLAGFEVVYAVLERSVLMIGFLALINLGLAFTGSFMLSAREMGEKR